MNVRNDKMLGTLHLHKFRGFNDYELADLTRVNLLVGKNNSGKTSILEAIHFLVSKGDPFVLIRSANRRGEINYASERYQQGGPDISHCFFSHRLEPGTGFRLSSDNYGQVSVQVHLADLENQSALFDDDDIDQSFPLVLQMEGNTLKMPALPVTESGSLSTRHLRFRRPWSETGTPPPPVQFVTPESLDLDPMREMWDKVLTEGRESEVIAAMQILENNLESIHFLTSDASRTRSGRAGALLGFHGGGRRVPLGSYGDGMRRLLALSLSLIQTAKGVLLVDEIDTGLHWTVMEEMWRLVIDTARRNSVQVFATTHSYDCLRGLASLVESRPDLVQDVSTQKIERALNRAVRFDATDIQAAVEQNIEVR
jgi:ABC-type branched-subunit amino acid transport system ATPase component